MKAAAVSEWDTLLGSLDQMIRAGQLAEARRQLLQLRVRSLPRVRQAAFANIARRIGLENWGLELLAPIVRSEKPVHPPVNVEEKTIYAALLIKVGAVIEALNILEGLQDQDHPEVFLYSAYAHIARWEHPQVIRYLKKYLRKARSSDQISDYQVAIARMNLTAALVSEEKYLEVLPLLQKLEKTCRRRGWTLLLGNCLEVSAQVALGRGLWEEAERFLREAEHLGRNAHKYLLFVEKWRVISKLLQAPHSSNALQGLEVIKRKAVEVRDWETVRDMDFHQARCQGDRTLWLRLYFGTPYRSYRKKIEKLFAGQGWQLPEEYLWPNPATESSRVLDIFAGTEGGKQILKPGQSLHRFLILLSLDFYRPLTMGYIFSKVYSGEYFNPVSSPDRVLQLIKRARKLFAMHNLPLAIEVKSGQCRLVCAEDFSIRLKRNFGLRAELKDLRSEDVLSKIKKVFQHRSFSIRQAAEKISLSETQLRKVLKKALSQNQVFVSGVGRATVYRFEK